MKKILSRADTSTLIAAMIATPVLAKQLEVAMQEEWWGLNGEG